MLSAFVQQTVGSDEGELPLDSREPKDEEEQDERKDQEEDDEQSRSNWVRLWREGAFTSCAVRHMQDVTRFTVVNKCFIIINNCPNQNI